MITSVYIESNKLHNLNEKSLELSDINCMYGNHEGGKTALLAALYQLMRTGELQPNLEALFESISITLDNGEYITWVKGAVNPEKPCGRVEIIANEASVAVVSKYLYGKTRQVERQTRILEVFNNNFGKFFASETTLSDIEEKNLSPKKCRLLTILSVIEFNKGEDFTLLVDDICEGFQLEIQRNMIRAMKEIGSDFQLICTFRSPSINGRKFDALISLNADKD